MRSAPETHAERLRQWLSQRLSMPTVLSTGPAPIWSADDAETGQAERLEALDRALSVDELSFDPERRHMAALEPAGLGALRRHEGKPPAVPAVVCPENSESLKRISDIAASCGFALSTPGTTAPSDNTLPIDFARMNAVEIRSAGSGLALVGRGASWDEVSTAAQAEGLCVPTGIETICATPAEAAEAGLFSARPAETSLGIACSFELVLPVAGTRLSDGIWLFRDAARALEAFRDLCTGHRPFHAALYSDTTLRLGERAGLWRLPDRAWHKGEYAALRMTFIGKGMPLQATRLAATYPVERRGGKFWRRGALHAIAEQQALAMANGLTLVSRHEETDFDRLPERRDALRQALNDAAAEASPVPGATPLSGDTLTYLNGRLQLGTQIIAPRDFADPVGQWQRLAGLEITDTQGDDEAAKAPIASAEDKAMETSEVTEMGKASDGKAQDDQTQDDKDWDGIRAQLLPQKDDGTGEHRPAAAVPPSLRHQTS